jgi:cellulose synthase/poly-beta-1,6-N-acetylglucosamine synthase-like glycosyltransferase
MNSQNDLVPSRQDAKIPCRLNGLARDLPSLARKSEAVASLPFISVIVPVRNEADHIQRTLIQLLTQDYDCRRFEVIVADGQSTDETWSIVAALQKEYANLQLLLNPRRWSSAGRNAALRVAQGDILVVIDGHCKLDDPFYLTHLAEAFERSGADCVGRPQPLDISGATHLQRAIALARSSRLGHHPQSWIYSDVECYVPPESVAVAYRREVFQHAGLFDENFDACEDVEFNHRIARAGMTCFFTPRVQVRYVPRDSLSGLFRQMVRYGRGRRRLLRKHPDTFSISCLLPAIFLSGVAIGPIFAWTSPWLLASYLGGLGIYMLTILVASLVLAFHGARNPHLFRDFGSLLARLPLIFATIHLGAGVGFLQELMVEGWSRIRNAFGLSQYASKEASHVLAWRTGGEGAQTPIPARDFPQSFAG